jgi:hypothetical protein
VEAKDIAKYPVVQRLPPQCIAIQPIHCAEVENPGLSDELPILQGILHWNSGQAETIWQVI